MAIRMPLPISAALIILMLHGTAHAGEPVPAAKPVPAGKPVIVIRAVNPADAVVQVQIVKKNAAAQKAAAKKLVEAQKAVAAASRALADARREAARATNPKEKAAAAKRVAEAQKKSSAARKLFTKALAERRKAAGVQVLQRGYPRVAAVAVREDDERDDPIERFALLTPGGPVVVEVSLTLNGKPYRVAREELIDQMVSAADKDKDGKTTWTEALDSPRFTMGRIRLANKQQAQQYIKVLDKNSNGLVDRVEARRFIAQYFQGPAFSLSGSSYSPYGFSSGGGVVVLQNSGVYGRRGQRADVQKLLDTDNDGVLSAKEIAAAEARLKSRDADDNDLLDASELGGGTAAGNARTRVIRSYQRQPRTQLAVLLGPTSNAGPLFKALQQKYQNKAGDIPAAAFRVVPGLFEKLDLNKNGKLEQSEVLALNSVKPHVQLAAALGKTAAGSQGLSLKAVDPAVKKSQANAASVTVELPGIKLSFVTNPATPRTYDYTRTAQLYLTRYDNNKNGYLEKKELPSNYFARQFAVWDADSDGKVYAKEIVAAFDRQQAPQKTQIRASAASGGNSLFEALDLSGDGRLSLREMKTAHLRIKTFDKNKDGKITPQEIPVTFSVTFGQTGSYYGSRVVRRPGSQPARPAKSDAPSWFTRMDRNGDGDVTLKEWLGDKADFKKIDTNGDGFIEPKEAKAAKSPGE